MLRKKIFLIITGNLIIASILVGCAPELARTKYGKTENKWKQKINKYYRNWEPAPTPPPLNEKQDSFQDLPELNKEQPSAKKLNNIMNTVENIESRSSNNKQNVDKSVGKESKGISKKTYIIKKGDTLWSISKEYYGKGKNWKKIRKANKEDIKKPNKLKPGIKIVIPASE